MIRDVLIAAIRTIRKAPRGHQGLLGALAVAVSAAAANAQTCGDPVGNALAESAVCDSTVRISWTNPSGLVFPKVWRNSSPDFASATLIANPGLGGPTTVFDTPPTGNTNSFYWIGGDVIGCQGIFEVRQLPLVGPLQAGRFTVNTYPAARAQAACSGINISWQPAKDVTNWTLVRVSTANYSRQDTLGIFPRTTTSYFDAEVLPGNQYIYGVFAASACAAPNGTSPSGLVRAGPWAAAGAGVAVGNVGSSAVLIVSNPSELFGAISSPAPTSMFWSRNGLPLSDGSKYGGTTSPFLNIFNLTLEDAGFYTLHVQNACRQFPVTAVLAVTQPCRADFNQSGAVGVQDLFDYLTAFFAGCP